MDKNGLLIALLFLFMIVLDRSNALNSRKLVTTSDPNATSNANQGSPLPSPLSNEKQQNPSPVEVTKPKDSPMTSPSDVESKGLNDTETKKSSENSSDKKLNKGKSQDGKDKLAKASLSKTIASESCNGSLICKDQEKTMIACIQDFDGSKNLTLLMQNERDITMKVNIIFMSSVNKSLPAFEIPGRGIEKLNITFSGDKNTKIILNAGHGDCELPIRASKSKNVGSRSKSMDVNDPADSPAKPKDIDNPADDSSKSKDADGSANPKDVKDNASNPKDENTPVKIPQKDDGPSKSKGTGTPPKAEIVDAPPDTTNVNIPTYQSNVLKQLSFYSKQVTPVYGAYFAFLVALIIGGSWAFCSFRKRRSEGGVAYQELEMGLPESSNAVDVETAEGWDQDWDDDDWDEDKAIRSPGGGNQTKTISSNGLTSRSTKKDGWDASWDD